MRVRVESGEVYDVQYVHSGHCVAVTAYRITIHNMAVITMAGYRTVYQLWVLTVYTRCLQYTRGAYSIQNRRTKHYAHSPLRTRVAVNQLVLGGVKRE